MASEESNGIYASIFNLARSAPFPTNYEEVNSPVTEDVLEVGWIVGFMVLYICLLLFLPAMNLKEKLFYFIRVTVILFVGLVVIYCNFGQEWEVGEIQSHMLYKAGSHEEINARVAVKLGLRSVNITLKALEDPKGNLKNEIINYNERFTWAWDQGRAGFGPFAGRIQREFRAAQIRGLPYPILWVAEYFTFDGEGIRFGRHYRHAGWYAHICLWSAFPAWILTIIMFKMVISYGAFMLSLLGCLQVSAALIWCSYRNFNELAIVFNDNDEPGKGILKTTYGLHWYLTLIVGLCCIISGILLIVLDHWFHDELCRFFGTNPLAILDETYEDEEPKSSPVDETGAMEMQPERPRIERHKSKIIFRARGTNRALPTTIYESSPQTFGSNLQPQHNRMPTSEMNNSEQSTSTQMDKQKKPRIPRQKHQNEQQHQPHQNQPENQQTQPQYQQTQPQYQQTQPQYQQTQPQYQQTQSQNQQHQYREQQNEPLIQLPGEQHYPQNILSPENIVSHQINLSYQKTDPDEVVCYENVDSPQDRYVNMENDLIADYDVPPTGVRAIGNFRN